MGKSTTKTNDITDNTRRYFPNIIVTGTPGCGKTSTSELLQRSLNALLQEQKQEGKSSKQRTIPQYDLYNISEYAKREKLFESFDEVRNSHIIDEDALLDNLEPVLRRGGNIIDWHCNDIFPERLIDLVVVLRCENAGLIERLTKRKYSDFKLNENLDAEIMGVVLQDALDSYVQDIVIELQSNNVNDMETNSDRISSWVEMWCKQHKEKGVTNEVEEFYQDRDDVDFKAGVVIDNGSFEFDGQDSDAWDDDGEEEEEGEEGVEEEEGEEGEEGEETDNDSKN